MKESKKVLSPISIIMIAQIVVLLILSIIITITVSSTTKKSSLDHMAVITDERAEMIDSYVKDAESTLIAYSQAAQIVDLLKNPTDEVLQGIAQKYTEEFSENIENLEGIYASEWDTHVLTHTTPGTVGIITRKDEESRKALHDSLLSAGDGVYDTGIIISPATSRQIVSMYKAVYDENGEPIGLVGLGIFTSGLVEKLDNLSIRGLDNSFYSMINIKDGKYIFNKDSKLIGEEIKTAEVKALCEKYDESSNVAKEGEGSFEYKFKGKKYVSTYSYMPEHKWIIMLDDTKEEVFALTTSMRIYLGIFFIALIILIVIFNIIIRNQNKTQDKLSATILKSNQTKESLYTAMFKDVLTEVNNRIAFSVDVDKCTPSKETPYYFAMFNIENLSNINVKYGNDTGDWALVKTAEVLGKIFKDKKIYRTGSGEFIISVQTDNSPDEQQQFLSDVSAALSRLTAQNTTPAGKLSFGYDVAVIKKSSIVNTSVITALKNIIKNPEPTGKLPFVFKDMD